MIKKIFKLSILFLIVSCGNDKKVEPEIIQPKKEKIIKEFGFILNNYEVKKDTIDRGDSFGLILEKNELYYPKIFNIVNEVKKVLIDILKKWIEQVKNNEINLREIVDFDEYFNEDNDPYSNSTKRKEIQKIINDKSEIIMA